MRKFDELDAARLTAALQELTSAGWSVESEKGEPLCGFVPTYPTAVPARFVLSNRYFYPYAEVDDAK